MKMYPLSQNTFVTVRVVNKQPRICLKRFPSKVRFTLDPEELKTLVNHFSVLSEVVSATRVKQLSSGIGLTPDW